MEKEDKVGFNLFRSVSVPNLFQFVSPMEKENFSFNGQENFLMSLTIKKKVLKFKNNDFHSFP